MGSPFPGMDPYMEPHWLDVHTRLTTYAADALNESLPPDLVASTEERIAIESDDDLEQRYGPDVRVTEPAGAARYLGPPSPDDGPALKTPVRLAAVVEPAIERFIKIVQVGAERTVTVIKFISPTNKRSPGLQPFVAKRQELILAGVNVVEVDLVRQGNWRRLLHPYHCPPQFVTTYRATVYTGGDWAEAGLQPISLREPLPRLVIPLRRRDPEVALGLQSLIERVYERGRYAARLDYSAALEPPLATDDAAWAQGLLRRAGKLA